MNPRQRFVGSAALLIVMISTSAAAPQAATTKRSAPVPRAVVPLDSYDFGDVFKGELISQLFVIRNEGEAELRIDNLTTGCGCSVIDSDKVLAPGHEGKAELEVNTASQSGQISKIATLHTNDPDRPNIVLTVTANVLTSGDGGPVKGVVLRSGKHIGPIFLGPHSTVGFTMTQAKTAKAEFTVTVERGNLRILSIEARHFAGRIDTLAEGRSYKLVFELNPDGAPATLSEHVRVLTDSVALPYFFINLNATASRKPSP
ncbi:MAG TPA: DUF1573 domain-containing protein [Blastocatellia bacterium]|nr:DUF1573 domain-containing protein [Blastocatellia bacterium]